jgi:hypothetical protein
MRSNTHYLSRTRRVHHGPSSSSPLTISPTRRSRPKMTSPRSISSWRIRGSKFLPRRAMPILPSMKAATRSATRNPKKPSHGSYHHCRLKKPPGLPTQRLFFPLASFLSAPALPTIEPQKKNPRAGAFLPFLLCSNALLIMKHSRGIGGINIICISP